MIKEETVLYNVLLPDYLKDKIVHDKGLGHRLTMSLISSSELQKDRPRHDSAMLWRIEEKGLLVQTRTEISPNKNDLIISKHYTLDDEIADLQKGDSIKANMTVEASYCKVTRYPEEYISSIENFKPKGKRSYVPDDKIMEWVENKLHKSGLTPQKILINTEYTKIGKRRIKIADIKGDFTINDIDSFRESCLNGIGRSKNYGQGLIIIEGVNK